MAGKLDGQLHGADVGLKVTGTKLEKTKFCDPVTFLIFIQGQGSREVDVTQHGLSHQILQP